MNNPEDRCRKLLERLYPWIKAVNHVHLPDGTLLYASEVWDALHEGMPTDESE